MMNIDFSEKFEEIYACISHIRALAPATQLRRSIIMAATQIAKAIDKDFPKDEGDEFDLGNTGNAKFADWAEQKTNWLARGITRHYSTLAPS
jgi:hypothetical protein